MQVNRDYGRLVTSPLRACRAPLVLLAALSLVRCGESLSTEAHPRLDGHWAGAALLDQQGDSFPFDLALRQVGHSVTGTSTKPYGAQSVLITGVRHGDTVAIHLLPAEDVPTDIVGVIGASEITGQFWFSISPSQPYALVLHRVP